MTIYSIYKATNTINGKHYIGFDSNWPKRKKDHLKPSKKSNNYISIFHNAIKKYGKNLFDWEIIYQSLDGKHCLDIMEPYFIKEYNSFMPNGYNMTLGGNGPLGYKMLPKHVKRLSKLHKGKKHRLGYKEPLEVRLHGAFSRSKIWEIIKPSGESIIIRNLSKFCRENKLTQNLMIMVNQGKQTHHKGYKCKKLPIFVPTSVT